MAQPRTTARALALLCALITAACGTAVAPTSTLLSVAPNPLLTATTSATSRPAKSPAPPSEPTAAALSGDRAPTYGWHVPVQRSEFTRVPFRFTVPDGWQERNDGWQIRKGDEDHGPARLWKAVVGNIYADACTGVDAGGVIDVGPSADNLVPALMEQPVSIATGPFETTIGGYPAQRLDWPGHHWTNSKDMRRETAFRSGTVWRAGNRYCRTKLGLHR